MDANSFQLLVVVVLADTKHNYVFSELNKATLFISMLFVTFITDGYVASHLVVYVLDEVKGLILLPKRAVFISNLGSFKSGKKGL